MAAGLMAGVKAKFRRRAGSDWGFVAVATAVECYVYGLIGPGRLGFRLGETSFERFLGPVVAFRTGRFNEKKGFTTSPGAII
jgi:hypothetical protein